MALTGTKGLMVWCQRAAEGYNDVKVVNMTTSFRDGLAFCAIIHHFRPDLIDFDSLSKENVWENNQLAFDVAEQELNIPSLLDPDDMVALPVPDKLSIMTYVSQYYNYFKNKKAAAELGIKPVTGVGRTTVKRPMEEVSPFKGKEGIVPAKKSFPANTCQVCGKKVYLVEKVVSNNKLYHRSCFKCNKCGDSLRPGAAKVGVDPSQIECQHHQDKIWNLRTNMASRVNEPKGEKNDGPGSIWESRGTPLQQKQLPWKKNKQITTDDKSNKKTDVTPSPVKKPPIPQNPPSKVLHPHLSSQSNARAQFFIPEPAPPQQSSTVDPDKGKDARQEEEKIKKGLFTTLAGVRGREKKEEKKKLSVEQSTDVKKTKETVVDEPTETTVPSKPTVTPDKKNDAKPSIPSSKPWEAKIGKHTPTSVSQRIGMFSQNNNKKEVPKSEPLKKDPPIKEKEVKKPEPKPEKTEEDKIADKKPIVPGKGGVLAMISRMEEGNQDEQVSGEAGNGEVLEGSEGSSQAGEETPELEKKKDSSEEEKQDTEKLEKDSESDEAKLNNASDVQEKGAKEAVKENGLKEAVKENGFQESKDEEEEELDPDNPFFASEDEAEDGVEEKMETEVSEDDRGDLGEIEGKDLTGLDQQGHDESIRVVVEEVKGDEHEESEPEQGKDGDNIVVNKGEVIEDKGSAGTIEGEDKSAIENTKSDNEKERTSDKGATTAEDGKSERSKDSDDNYDDSLNPFGSDDDEEDSSSDSDSDLGPNNPFANSDEDEDEDIYDESLNPFGDDDDDEDDMSEDSKVNPFTGSPVSDTSFEFSPKVKPPRPPPPKTSISKKVVPKFKTREEILQEMQRARNTLKQKKRRAPNVPPVASPGRDETPSPGQNGTPSPGQDRLKAPQRSIKTRRAPLPPGVENGSVQKNDSDSPPVQRKISLDVTPDGSQMPSIRRAKSPKTSRPSFRPPPQPGFKMSKRRAPAPPPQKRDVRQHHVTPEEIQKEIAEIEEKTSVMVKKGIELEDKLRAEMKDDASEESEELLMEWFEVVNEKNQLVRREGELVAQAQIQDLEIQHAEVEYEMRCLMHKQEHEKTDEDNEKEEQLLELLIGLVQQRSTIVDRLEEDRIREQEEDETIRNMMQMKGLDRDSIETKKAKKKKKKKKKHKEKDKVKVKSDEKAAKK